MKKIWYRWILWHYNVCPKHLLQRKTCRETGYQFMCLECWREEDRIDRETEAKQKQLMEQRIETARKVLKGIDGN